MGEKIGEVEVGIAVDTEQVDEAIEKCGELSEVMGEFSPQVVIRNCRDCTFNIYPSHTVINEQVGC